MDGLPRSVNARLFCVDTGRQAMFHWMGENGVYSCEVCECQNIYIWSDPGIYCRQLHSGS